MKESFNLYQKLLEDFKGLPQVEHALTFIEICKYPRSRFEEVCSRILQFFLNPKAEHKFGNLWLSAFLDMIGYVPNNYYINDTTVDTEEYAEGKRIDITIKNKDFVIAIENKTTATLYNPLDIYKHYIEQHYANREHKFVVLSVKPFNDCQSRKWIADNSFKAFTYQDLFNAVNSRLGQHITHCDQKYLSYMLDFMNTIDNMTNKITPEEYDFFFKNEDSIEKLIKKYNEFNNALWDEQKAQIDILKTQLTDKTKANWQTWQQWDLYVKFNENTQSIGIESNFKKNKDEACGEFHIYITTWNKEDWKPYKEAVLNEFKEQIFLDQDTNNRVYLHLPIIYGNDTNKIIATLENVFNRLKNITDKIG